MTLTILQYFLMTVEVICSLLLVAVILVQRTKGQGMGLAIGGGMGETMFGSQMGNVLTKTTVVLAIIFLVNTTVLAILGARRPEGSMTDRVADVPTAPMAVPQQMPGNLGAPITGQPIEFPAAPAPEIPDAPEAAAPEVVPVTVPEAAPVVASEAAPAAAETPVPAAVPAE